MCVCVCAHVCTCVCAHVCVVCVGGWVVRCVHVCVHMCVHECVVCVVGGWSCVYMCVHAHVCGCGHVVWVWSCCVACNRVLRYTSGELRYKQLRYIRDFIDGCMTHSMMVQQNSNSIPGMVGCSSEKLREYHVLLINDY